MANRKAGGILGHLKLDPAMPDEAVNVETGERLDRWRPTGVCRQIRQLHRDVGGFGTLLTITYDPDDQALVQHSLRRLMEEVAPRVQDLECPPQRAGGAGWSHESLPRDAQGLSPPRQSAQRDSPPAWWHGTSDCG